MGVKYKVGDIVEMVRGERKHVRVDIKSRNIKDGKAGFSGVLIWQEGHVAILDEERVWGYDHHVVRVLDEDEVGW